MIQFNSRTVTVPLFRVGVPTPDLARILRQLELAREARAAERAAWAA